MQGINILKNRIELVDILRGFALMGILFLHSIEHFDFIWKTDLNPRIFSSSDPYVGQIIAFLFSGKSYSIFSLMFGFSFYIQMERAKARGVDFRGRFVWRLTLLFIIGCLVKIIYIGEILTMYALIGLLLVFFYPLNKKILTVISILLIVQVPTIFNIVHSCLNPDFQLNQNFGNGLYGEAFNIYANGTFSEAAKFNLWKGHIAVWAWSYYNGRYLQLLGLFIIGLVLGKKRFFENFMNYKKHTAIVLAVSIFVLIVLFSLLKIFPSIEMPRIRMRLFSTLIKSYADLAQTTVYISLITVIVQNVKKKAGLSLMANYGRLSLTNYILQPLIGVPLIYGYGFALYHYMGATMSIFYGVLFFIFQLWFSKFWLKHFYYGPFEWLWRALTFFNFSLKFRKNIHEN